jgi:beta-lactamase regulating signal transducer with metallopeptidase domain
MEIALYLAKTCGLTAVFYLAYHLLLRKETFFRANRWFLLAGMATAVLLPLAVYTKVVWVNPAPATPVNIIALTNLAQVKTVAPAPPTFEFEWWMGLLAVYTIVAAFLLARLFIDFKKIRALFTAQNATRFGRFKIIDSEAVKSPFSFFNYILYNSASLEPGELQGIISHEKVHSSQRHSIDILLAQLFCTAFWFNPFAWLYKKAIAQNLEFIADAEAIKHVDDATAYQKTMLKITLAPQNNTITSHFYQPLIKKRIIMINKPKSKKRNSVKYALVLPVLVAFIALFQIKTEAREKSPEIPAVTLHTTLGDTLISTIKFTITKDSKDENIKEGLTLITNMYGIETSFDAGRNNSKEITSIKVTLNGKGIDKSYKQSSTLPIKNLTVEVGRDANGKLTTNFSNPIEIEVTKNTIKADTLLYDRNAVVVFDDVMYVVDGVKQPKGSDLKTINIDANEIAAINVYKDQQIMLEKYGVTAKNGVIEITTKKNENIVLDKPQPKQSKIVIETEDDGKAKISSWTIQGTVEVSDATPGMDPEFRLANDGNTGFIIRKESTENDLDFCIKALAQNGITVKYSGVKRNSKGEITKIKFELDNNRGSKSEAKFEDTNGIKNLYVGEKDGIPLAYMMK